MATEADGPVGPELYPCPECHLGSLHAKTAFYCASVGGQFITIPDFPAWVCDVCGMREYDEGAVLELRTILQFERGDRDHSPRDQQPTTGRLVHPDLPNPGSQR
ncbi:MAG: YgiT-type zinc finger protein [Anaerolineales bacterium]